MNGLSQMQQPIQGGLAQSQPMNINVETQAPQSTGAAPMPGNSKAKQNARGFPESPLDQMPDGLLRTLYEGSQIGFGEAFLRRYGHKFEEIEGCDDLGELILGGTEEETIEETAGPLSNEWLDHVVRGALAQRESNVVHGGLT